MKTEQKQVETLIYEDESKQIALKQDDDITKIVKRFYDHDNRNIYVKIMQNPHPNISEVFRVFNFEGGFGIEEAYLGSQSLLDVSPIKDIEEGYDILKQLTSAVKHLHHLKIVHRDLKPENVFYNNQIVSLNDFDISKNIIKKSDAKQDTRILGSVGYASPEQYGFSTSDERTDIYSLGILINVLFTGVFINEQSLDGELGRIVAKCTQIHADDRYQSVAELEKDLEFARLNKSIYTLPGFRTNKLSTKIWSSIGYFFMFGTIFILESQDGVTFYDHFKSKVLGGIMILLTFVIATNYLNIKDLLPRKLRDIKFVGAIILWITLFVILVMIHSLFFAILDGML